MKMENKTAVALRRASGVEWHKVSLFIFMHQRKKKHRIPVPDAAKIYNTNEVSTHEYL